MVSRSGARTARWRNLTQVTRLLLWQIGALAEPVIAVILARQEHRGVAEALSDVSLAVVCGSALWVLSANTHLDRTSRNAAVLCLGVTHLTLFWRATNPLLFTGFDEQLHMRTLGDIISSHRLFEANPLLDVSPRHWHGGRDDLGAPTRHPHHGCRIRDPRLSAAAGDRALRRRREDDRKQA